MTTSTADQSEDMDFDGIKIAFDHRVLRPRPWTVGQSVWAAEVLLAGPPGRVLELCSGAGQIGLRAVLGNDRSLVCVDVSPVACGFTRRNAAAAGLGPRVEVREASISTALGDSEQFALVIADPPWVARAEVGRYPEDPVLAIDGGDDGMDVAWDCLDLARAHLVPGGSLLLQLGSIEQVDAVRARLEDDLLGVAEVRRHERGVLARLDRH